MKLAGISGDDFDRIDICCKEHQNDQYKSYKPENFIKRLVTEQPTRLNAMTAKYQCINCNCS